MHRFVIATLALLLTYSPVSAAEPAESIQGVISAQIEALGERDLEAAFAHASPFIQSKFQTPENFGRMVREGYPVIWRPSRYQMQDLSQTGRGTVQSVLLEDRAGRQFEALYEMREIDGTWRINGVYVRELPGIGS